MKFQILSDLHLEFFSNYNDKVKFIESLKTTCDYVLLAGDISTGNNILEDYNLISTILGDIIYVAGNHEYYRSSKQYIDSVMEYNINGMFLNNKSILINDIVIIGGTGWNEEFNLNKSKQINDYYLIEDLKSNPQITKEWSNETYNYFDMKLKNNNKKVICLTHNAPIKEFTPDIYKNSSINLFFSNKWYDLFEYNPTYWISGHIHSSSDFIFNKTRCIENSFGYLKQITSNEIINENKKFTKNLVIEV